MIDAYSKIAKKTFRFWSFKLWNYVMRIIPIKQCARHNENVCLTGPDNTEVLNSQRKPPFYPPYNEIIPSDAKSKAVSPKNIDQEIPGKNQVISDVNLKKKKEFLQNQWKLLKKLNSRFRKKICKQQQLKADINRLQKQILEVKQEIINLHL